jgi:hypothetical protein
VTATVEEDFGGFVAARWPDLEAVALVATLDPGAAREATAAALADLRSRWAATLEEGAPTTAARRALLDALRPARAPRAGDGPPPAAAAASLHLVVADPTSSVPEALLDALAGLPAPVRALLAAGPLWEVTDGELLGLVGPDGPGAGDLDAGRARLLAAHREARAVDGLPPADDLLDDDLAALVHRLATVQPEPPDPAGLVVERARRVRRRALVTGGGAMLVVGVAGAAGWAALGRGGGGSGSATAPSAAPTTAGPDDPAWATSSRWPARGALAGDLGVQALVARAGPGTRLLWADDIADLRVVVAATFAEDRPDSTAVRAWTGPPGTAAEALTEVVLGVDAVLGVEDVVAVGLDRPGGAVLVALTRPTERTAAFSPVVRPTPAGSVERTYTTLALADGVGTLLLPERWGLAGRVRVAGYDGASVAPRTWGGRGPHPGGGDPMADLMATVASSTGVPPEDLRGAVLVDSPTDGSVLDPTAVSATGGDGRAVLTSVRLPNGAVVRGLDVRDDGRSGGGVTFLGTSPVVVPARFARAPALLRVDDSADRTGRFLVVVPGGGATCQLLATSPNAYPVSKVVPMKRSTAVVPVVNADDASAFRLVVKDAGGRTTYDDVPPTGRDLAGYDDGTGWLGLAVPYT